MATDLAMGEYYTLDKILYILVPVEKTKYTKSKNINKILLPVSKSP